MAALSCSSLQRHSSVAFLEWKQVIHSDYYELGPGNIMCFVHDEWQQELQMLSTEFYL